MFISYCGPSLDQSQQTLLGFAGSTMPKARYCSALDKGHACRYGCSHTLILCHRFARGECWHKSDEWCHGFHHKPTNHRDQMPRGPRVRGDGFRPYTTDTTVETELKQHLSTLMLSSKIEDLLDLDSEMIDTVYRKLALKRHPDKADNGGASKRFIQLQKARDYVKEILPFRNP